MSRRIDLGTLLAEQAATFRDRPFLRLADDSDWISYGDFNNQVNRLAHGFAELGLRQGDFVAIMLPNCIEFVMASYALKKLGIVEVAINAEFRGPALERMINLTEAPVLVTSADYSSALELVGDGLRHIRTLVSVGQFAPFQGHLGGIERVEFSALITGDGTEPRRTTVDTDLQAILFTSGTTGLSKGCTLTHRFAVRVAESVVDTLSLTRDDCVYVVYPLHHASAPLGEILPSLLVGGRAALDRRFSLSNFWTTARSVGATWFEIIGSVQKLLWDQPPLADDADNPVRIAWGGPLPVPLEPFEARFGLRVVPGGGYSSSDLGCVGEPEFGRTSSRIRDIYEVRIADEFDDEVPAGEVGEILVRPREPFIISQGYFGMPEATVEAWRNLWFHSGDLGRLDPDGYLNYLGRKSDRIRRRGENVSVIEVEEVVMSYPSVSECAVIGVASVLGEQDIKAFVTVRDGHHLDVDELFTYCRERLARFMIPDEVVVLDEMPHTPTGKPAKSELESR